MATANPAYSSADGVLFNKNLTTLLQCPGAKTDSYTVPGTVTNIAVGAFSSCANLTNISLPGGLISLGDDAFSWCASLTGITIPEGVARLGDRMFAYCDQPD